MSLPVTPIPEGRKATEFIGLNHIMIGARYMILPEIGVKLSYAYEKFSDKDNRDDNLVNNRIELQVVSNLLYLFNVGSGNNTNFGLLAHAGGGITYANPSVAINNERVGNLIFGIEPIFRISDRLAIPIDFSYTYDIKKHFGFDGKLLNADFEPQTGGYINITVGLKYYFGKNRDHADWL